MNKPGVTTTEFWSTMVTHVLALIALVRPDLIVQGPSSQGLVQAFALLASSVAAAIYSLVRARVKVATKDATALVVRPPSDLATVPLIDKTF